MNELRMRRWMGPIGLLVPVLIVVAFGPLGGGAPEENASGASVVAYYNTHMTKQWIAVYLVVVALAAMLVFVSQLRGVLRDTERSRSVLPNIAYGAGLLFVGGFLVAGMIQVALMLAAHNNEFAIAKTLNFLGSNNELPFIFGITALLAATGLSVLRSSLPKWLGWLTVVIAVVCLAGPFGFFGILAAGIWVPVMGFVAGAKATSTPPSTPPEVPAVPEIPTAPAPNGTLVH
jgi:protein-S-isoprenylcysteine O-methyltransferase Ste14